MINEDLHRIEVCTVILMQLHLILYWKLHIGNYFMVFLLASAFYAENMETIHKMLYCIYISYRTIFCCSSLLTRAVLSDLLVAHQVMPRLATK